ncbi:hypothetical protein EDC04DRAFT_919441 [Pisolithus marmoratus]|nr:hypothetical protein EDC04DRAFT_919441 [Pisolithus marmoratus]
MEERLRIMSMQSSGYSRGLFRASESGDDGTIRVMAFPYPPAQILQFTVLLSWCSRQSTYILFMLPFAHICPTSEYVCFLFLCRLVFPYTPSFPHFPHTYRPRACRCGVRYTQLVTPFYDIFKIHFVHAQGDMDVEPVTVASTNTIQQPQVQSSRHTSTAIRNHQGSYEISWTRSIRRTLRMSSAMRMLGKCTSSKGQYYSTPLAWISPRARKGFCQRRK